MLRQAKLRRSARLRVTANQAESVKALNFVSGRARSQWYLNVGLQLYLLVTLMSVEDADFFAIERNTELPILNISVPTTSFFVFAAVLCFGLFVSMQIHLLRLWGGLREVTSDGRKCINQVQPWLVVDMARMMLGSRELTARPLSLVVLVAGLFGVWISAPILLVALWWRYMTSHQTINSLLLAALVSLSILVAMRSWQNFCSIRRDTPAKNGVLSATATFMMAFLFVTTISWARTSHETVIGWSKDGPFLTIPSLTVYRVPSDDHIQYEAYKRAFDQQSELKRFVAESVPIVAKIYGLAPIDLRGVNLVPQPADWLPQNQARRAQKTEICELLGFGEERCDLIDWVGGVMSNEEIQEREKWCEAKGIVSNCLSSFDWQDGWARATWSNLRGRQRSALADLDLRNADLRGADLSGAFLVGADLTGARMEFSVLHSANLEGASLEGAVLWGSSAWRTNFDWINAWRSNWANSTLYGARFRDAKLRGASFFGADIWHTEILRADLWGVGFRDANLRAVDLSRSSFWGGSLEGAKLDGVQLHGAKLSYVRGITQLMLDGAIGDGETVLTRRADYDFRPNHRIAECWPEIPSVISNTPQRPGVVRFSYVIPIDWKCEDADRRWHEASLPSAGTYDERVIPGEVEVRIYSDDSLRPFGRGRWELQ